MRQIAFSRRVVITFAALCCLCWHCAAQIDTTLRAFFPLQHGDLWEYEVDDYPTYPRFQVRNVGDTLMPNGKVYFHLQGPEPGGYYRMDDSLRVFRYSPEYLSCTDSEFVVYDLSLYDGGMWPTCLPSQFSPSHIGIVGTTVIFYPRLGLSAVTKQFCEAQIDSLLGDTTFCPLVQSIPYSPQRLAKGFGFVWTQYEGPATNLDGAIINGIQYGNVTSVGGSSGRPGPRNARLEQNYPNPFNPATTIRYQLPEDGFVVLSVFDILGRSVATLVNGQITAGYHSATFGADGLSSGVYFVRMSVSNRLGKTVYEKSSKLMLTK